MDTQVIQQLFREFALTCSSVILAYCLVGGFIFLEGRLKKAIIDSVRNS